MNTWKRPVAAAALASRCANGPNPNLACVAVRDRFGDHGVVGLLVVAETSTQEWSSRPTSLDVDATVGTPNTSASLPHIQPRPSESADIDESNTSKRRQFCKLCTSDSVCHHRVHHRRTQLHYSDASKSSDGLRSDGEINSENPRLDDALDVETFLLSCRSLHLGVEHAMMRHLASLAIERGLPTIRIRWRPSERNDAACHFFSRIPGARFVEDDAYGSANGAAGANRSVNGAAEGTRPSGTVGVVHGGAADAYSVNGGDDEAMVENTHDADGVVNDPSSSRHRITNVTTEDPERDDTVPRSSVEGDRRDQQDEMSSINESTTGVDINSGSSHRVDSLMMFWTPDLEPMSKRDRKRELRRRARVAQKRDEEARETRRRARALKRAAEREKQPRVEQVRSRSILKSPN